MARSPQPDLPPRVAKGLPGHFTLKPASQSADAPLVKRAPAARSLGANRDIPRFSGKQRNTHWNRFSHRARKRVLP